MNMAKLAAAKSKVTASQRPPLKPAFVGIARAVLLYPPIAHRHTPAAKNFLTPFEFGVAMAVIVAATQQLSEDRHARAWEQGGERIQRQKHQLQAAQRKRGPNTKDYPFTRHQRESEHLIATGHEPTGKERVNVRHMFELEGRHGYARSRERQREQGPPPTIRVQQSRRRLLTSVGLPANTTSYLRLQAALDRLVAAGVANEPPVLTAWMRLQDGQVRFRVNGAWLDLRGRGFAKLPLPLPSLRSPTALALYLFLNSIQTTDVSAKGILPGRLFARLGLAISRRRGSKCLSATLGHALAIINAHLAKLDEAILRKHELDAVPRRYEIKVIGKRRQDKQLRFVAIPRNLDDREDMEAVLEQRQRARAEAEDEFSDDEQEEKIELAQSREDDARLQALTRKAAYAEGGSDYDY
jgi:hypothetical protein